MGGLGQDESLQKEQQTQGTWDGNELVESEEVAQQEACDRSGVRWSEMAVCPKLGRLRRALEAMGWVRLILPCPLSVSTLLWGSPLGDPLISCGFYQPSGSLQGYL